MGQEPGKIDLPRSLRASFALACILPAVFACDWSDAQDGGVDDNNDRIWSICESGYLGSPRDVAAVQHDALVEMSGIAPSAYRDDLVWTHNDSGDSARIFAVGVDGTHLGTLALGIDVVDLEDIAQAPCPDDSGPCLWLADTGDNRRERRDAKIVVVPEPKSNTGESIGDAQVGSSWRFPIEFLDGPIDVEALAVDGDGQSLLLLEKTTETNARAFSMAAPWQHGVTAVPTEIATFTSPGVAGIDNGTMITGADLHPSGDRLLVRVYTGLYEYDLAGKSAADLDEIEPTLVALGPISEPQGEAIAFDLGGTGIWTVSEDPAGQPGQMLHHFPCLD